MRTNTVTHRDTCFLPHTNVYKVNTLKHIKREINKVLPEDKNMQLVYKGTKLEIKFNINNKLKKRAPSRFNLQC